MSELTANDYLDHLRQAAREACDFVAGMEADDFRQDRRTQQAVIMNLVIIGEAAARPMDRCPELVSAYPGLPWQGMRGMRNRIAHGYFEIDLDIVWETVCTDLPRLLHALDGLGEIDC